MEQEEFQKKLEEALAVARKNHNELSQDQFREAFGELTQDPKHREILLSYFASKNVIVYTGDSDLDAARVQKAVEAEFSYTPEDKAYIEEYQRDLEQLTVLDTDALHSLIHLALEGDRPSQGELLSAYLQKAADLARTFTGQGVLLEDLIGEANLALAEAIPELGSYVEKTEDPAEQAREVEGFLGTRMIDAMEQLVRSEMDLKEEDQAMADQVNRVADAAAQLSRDLLHKVSVKELAEHTDMTEEEIRETLRILGNGRGDVEILSEEED